MATGQAPSDIISARGKGYVRGKIMGQSIDACGVATANVGHNRCGGITAVCDAAGQCQTTGPCGYLHGQGQTRAAAATAREVNCMGQTVTSGAAAAQASGMVRGALPNGQGFAARGSASAQAEGQVLQYGNCAKWSKKRRLQSSQPSTQHSPSQSSTARHSVTRNTQPHCMLTASLHRAWHGAHVFPTTIGSVS
jgi:hypothetical protein